MQDADEIHGEGEDGDSDTSPRPTRKKKNGSKTKTKTNAKKKKKVKTTRRGRKKKKKLKKIKRRWGSARRKKYWSALIRNHETALQVSERIHRGLINFLTYKYRSLSSTGSWIQKNPFRILKIQKREIDGLMSCIGYSARAVAALKEENLAVACETYKRLRTDLKKAFPNWYKQMRLWKNLWRIIRYVRYVFYAAVAQEHGQEAVRKYSNAMWFKEQAAKKRQEDFLSKSGISMQNGLHGGGMEEDVENGDELPW